MADEPEYMETGWGPIPRHEYRHLKEISEHDRRMTMTKVEFWLWIGKTVPSFILAIATILLLSFSEPTVRLTDTYPWLSHYSSEVAIMAIMLLAIGVIWITATVLLKVFRWRLPYRARRNFESECRKYRQEHGEQIDHERIRRQEREAAWLQEQREAEESARVEQSPKPPPIAETPQELEALAQLEGPSEPI